VPRDSEGGWCVFGGSRALWSPGAAPLLPAGEIVRFATTHSRFDVVMWLPCAMAKPSRPKTLAEASCGFAQAGPRGTSESEFRRVRPAFSCPEFAKTGWNLPKICPEKSRARQGLTPPSGKQKPRQALGLTGFSMVGVARIELATPAMSTQCSTTELHAHGSWANSGGWGVAQA
jgi:hypothetical protein